MKKFALSILSLLLICISSGCGKPNREISYTSYEPVSNSSVSDYHTDTSDTVSDADTVSAQPSYQTSSVSFPTGVSTYSKGKLRYTNSVLSLSVIFPDDFFIENKDFKPDFGVYLQNDTGTATLLLQSVTDNTVTHKDMFDYLKQLYPDAQIYITDSKEIVCKRSCTDNSGNLIFTLQKIKTKSGGYNQIVLSCRSSEKDVYEKVFGKINFS